MSHSVSPIEDENGFSIFEALVAFLILSMVLVGSIQLVSSSTRVIGAAKNFKSERAAITGVRSELERLIAENDGTIASELVLKGQKTQVDPIVDDQPLVSGRRLYRILIWPEVEAGAQPKQPYLGYLSLPEQGAE